MTRCHGTVDVVTSSAARANVAVSKPKATIFAAHGANVRVLIE
jgi:hypothetical protein